ncbi:MAG: protein kinase [bacterium]|nr:protein kinase [bacterium]
MSSPKELTHFGSADGGASIGEGELARLEHVEFSVLGALEVSSGGTRLPIDSPMQRALLALLLIHANETVSTDQIQEALWGDQQPESGLKALRFHVSKLRSAIEIDNGEGPIVTQSPGYKATATARTLDSMRFEASVGSARGQLGSDPVTAVERLHSALGLWRGKPYEEFQYDDWAAAEVARLDELRLATLEDRVDAELALGRHFDLTGELEALVAENPFRERMAAQLMLALYRSGRQRDSLLTFQLLRDRLVEELGADPTSELVRLENQILQQDPDLDVRIDSKRPGSARAVRGYELRENVGTGRLGAVHRAYERAAGREVALKVIDSHLADDASFIQRFEVDTQLVSRLEHPHIAPTFDYWREPGNAYIATRWTRGGDLEDLLQRGPLAAEHAMTLLEQLGSAISYAHRRGITHRDIKASNVLIDDDGTPYLTDFVNAALLDAAHGVTGMASAPNASPEQVAGGPAGKATDVYQLALLGFELFTGQHPYDAANWGDRFSLPLPAVQEIVEDLPDALNKVLSKGAAQALVDRYAEVETFVSELRGAVGGLEPAVVVASHNPYKGLSAFDEADAAVFFGRSSLVETIVKRLDSSGVASRFLAIVGPSGSGKSSVARAGLIPALRSGAVRGSERWLVADMFPGERPFANLATALAAVTSRSPDELETRIGRDEEGIHDAVRRALPDESWELFLLIDQFEELFNRADEEARRTFIDGLVAAIRHPRSQLRVVATLRADFYDRPLMHSELGQLMSDTTLTILPLSPSEMEEAIVRPADLAGAVIEPGVVGQVLGDVADQPGALPLMQFAMTELFDNSTDGSMTLEGYEAIGGVSGALTQSAERVLSGLGPDSRQAARRMFLELVELGEGTEDTRRRVRLTDLERLGDEDLSQAVAGFGDARLLQFDRDPATRTPTTEVAHEALIREWPQLRGWIDSSRDDLRTVRRLEEQAREWQKSGRDDSFLLSGSRLAAADGVSDPAIDVFLDASRNAAAKGRRRNAIGVTALAALAMMLAVVSVLALLSSRRADEAAHAATAAAADADLKADQAAESAATASQRAAEADSARTDASQARDEAVKARVEAVASQALATLDSNPALGLGLAIEAASQSATDSTLRALAAATESFAGTEGLLTGSMAGFGGTVWSLAVTEDGTQLVAATDDERGIQIWDVDTRMRVAEWSELHDEALREIALSPNGSTLATASLDDTVKVWDLASGDLLLTLVGHTNQVWKVDFSPDGERIATGSTDGTARVWNAATGELLTRIDVTPAAADPDASGISQVWSVRFSPNGSRLATAGEDGFVRIWDIASAAEALTIVAHTAPAQDIAWFADGERLVSAGDDGDAAVWDAVTGARLGRRLSHDAGLRSVALSSDEASIVTAGVSGEVHLWDAGSLSRTTVMSGHPGLIWDVAFLPGDRLIASAGLGGTINLWDTEPSRGAIALEDHIDLSVGFARGARGIAFHPDGASFVAAMRALPTTRFSVDSGDVIVELPSAEAHSQYVAYNQAGDVFAVGRIQDGVVEFFEHGGGSLGTIETGDSVRGLTFDQSGSLLLVGTATGGTLVYQYEGRQLLRELPASDEGVRWVVATSDGRAIVAGGDNLAQVWDIDAGTKLDDLPGHESEVRVLALSPDERFVASASGDGEIRVWDLSTYDVALSWTAHDSGIRGLAWHPDGNVLASSGEDTTIRLWDAATGESLVTMRRQVRGVWGLAWSPDGTKLVSGSDDGVIVIREYGTLPAQRCGWLAPYLADGELEEALGQAPQVCR